nr:hypothetical protein [Tanacetum cinerariifolium]
MVVQNQSQLGEGLAILTSPHHTPTIIKPSTQPQKKQQPRKPKRKDTQVPQPIDLIENVPDEAVHKEVDDSLVRAATTASSLEAKQDSASLGIRPGKTSILRPGIIDSTSFLPFRGKLGIGCFALRDEAQAENEDFINKLDENIQKIIKEQVKEQVKVPVSKILPKIEKTVNEQLEAEMERNKSIHRSNEQRNLYKALVDAYECDKIILDTYGDIVTLKRRRDDADNDEEPSAGSDRGSKRRREGKEPESISAPNEKPSKTTGKSTERSKSHQKTASESAPAEEPMQTTQDLEEPSH